MPVLIPKIMSRIDCEAAACTCISVDRLSTVGFPMRCIALTTVMDRITRSAAIQCQCDMEGYAESKSSRRVQSTTRDCSS